MTNVLSGQLRVVLKGYTVPIYLRDIERPWSFGIPFLAQFKEKLLVKDVDGPNGRVIVYAQGKFYWSFYSYLERYTQVI